MSASDTLLPAALPPTPSVDDGSTSHVELASTAPSPTSDFLVFQSPDLQFEFPPSSPPDSFNALWLADEISEVRAAVMARIEVIKKMIREQQKDGYKLERCPSREKFLDKKDAFRRALITIRENSSVYVWPSAKIRAITKLEVKIFFAYRKITGDDKTAGKAIAVRIRPIFSDITLKEANGMVLLLIKKAGDSSKRPLIVDDNVKALVQVIDEYGYNIAGVNCTHFQFCITLLKKKNQKGPQSRARATIQGMLPKRNPNGVVIETMPVHSTVSNCGTTTVCRVNKSRLVGKLHIRFSPGEGSEISSVSSSSQAGTVPGELNGHNDQGSSLALSSERLRRQSAFVEALGDPERTQVHFQGKIKDGPKGSVPSGSADTDYSRGGSNHRDLSPSRNLESTRKRLLPPNLDGSSDDIGIAIPKSRREKNKARGMDNTSTTQVKAESILSTSLTEMSSPTLPPCLFDSVPEHPLTPVGSPLAQVGGQDSPSKEGTKNYKNASGASALPLPAPSNPVSPESDRSEDGPHKIALEHTTAWRLLGPKWRAHAKSVQDSKNGDLKRKRAGDVGAGTHSKPLQASAGEECAQEPLLCASNPETTSRRDPKPMVICRRSISGRVTVEKVQGNFCHSEYDSANDLGGQLAVGTLDGNNGLNAPPTTTSNLSRDLAGSGISEQATMSIAFPDTKGKKVSRTTLARGSGHKTESSAPSTSAPAAKVVTTACTTVSVESSNNNNSPITTSAVRMPGQPRKYHSSNHASSTLPRGLAEHLFSEGSPNDGISPPGHGDGNIPDVEAGPSNVKRGHSRKRSRDNIDHEDAIDHSGHTTPTATTPRRAIQVDFNGSPILSGRQFKKPRYTAPIAHKDRLQAAKDYNLGYFVQNDFVGKNARTHPQFADGPENPFLSSGTTSTIVMRRSFFTDDRSFERDRIFENSTDDENGPPTRAVGRLGLSSTISGARTARAPSRRARQRPAQRVRFTRSFML